MKRIVTLDTGSGPPSILTKDHSRYVRMPDSEWAKEIHHYSDLTDEGKEKQRRKKLKGADIVCKAKAPRSLPNVPKKWIVRHTATGPVRASPDQQDYQLGAQTLLSLPEVFPDSAVGYTMAATILCGMRAHALQCVEPTFRPAMAINCPDRLNPLFAQLVASIIPRKKWPGKNCVIRMSSVLDLTKNSANIQNFSRIKVRHKKIRSVDFPFPYVDTVTLVLGAKDGQWGQMASHLKEAGAILLNCKLGGDWGAKKVPSYVITQYNPNLANTIIENAPYMAALLRWWWKAKDTSDWAESVIQAAKDTLGKPDGRYVSVEFDPMHLRRAIYHQVLLSFLDDAGRHGWLTPEEVESHRQAVSNVFDPGPPTPTAPRCAEDPEVFLEVMRALVAEHPDHIAGIDEPYHANKRQFAAAWRDIGKVRHLVVLESVWKAAYTKAVRADKSIDPSFLERTDWALELQKVLSEKGMIKPASSGYRYRYDLWGNGTKDKTYVLAIPATLLDS